MHFHSKQWRSVNFLFVSFGIFCFLILSMPVGADWFDRNMDRNTKKAVKFEPEFKLKFSSRDSVKIANSKSDYRGPGYIVIGAVYVEHVSETCFSKRLGGKRKCKKRSYSKDTTSRLMTEAAKHGGDVVAMRQNNKKGSGRVIRRGKCIKPEYRVDLYGKTYYYCPQYETTSGTKIFTRSSASILRYDPVLAQRNKYENLFFQAIRAGNRAQVTAIVNKGISVKDPDLHGRYPLVTAVRANKTGVTKFLLDREANPNVQDTRALIYSITHNNSQIVEMLLNKGANPNARAGIIKSLLNAGKGKGRDDLGAIRFVFPLVMATENNQVSIAKLLLEKGANPNASRGQPLKNAMRWKNTAMIKLLFANGARAGKGKMLHSAVQTRDVDMVRMLLDMGVKVDSRSTKEGISPLHLAARNGSAEIIVLLVERGANVNNRTLGVTNSPLMDAVNYGHVQAVKVLIAANAKVNANSKPRGIIKYYGLSKFSRKPVTTVLSIAKSKLAMSTSKIRREKFQAIISMLVAAGAKS